MAGWFVCPSCHLTLGGCFLTGISHIRHLQRSVSDGSFRLLTRYDMQSTVFMLREVTDLLAKTFERGTTIITSVL